MTDRSTEPTVWELAAQARHLGLIGRVRVMDTDGLRAVAAAARSVLVAVTGELDHRTLLAPPEGAAAPEQAELPQGFAGRYEALRRAAASAGNAAQLGGEPEDAYRARDDFEAFLVHCAPALASVARLAADIASSELLDRYPTFSHFLADLEQLQERTAALDDLAESYVSEALPRG